ncbi:MAG TPA: NrsF family protein [Bryobacteraceae bacterium]|nr:NrsF family protein [Bryobacteraceae bacterium]
MTCQEINELLDRRLVAAGAALPQAVLEHLERCEGCRRLVRFLCPESQPETPRIAEETYERITRCLQASLHAVKPAPAAGFFFGAFVGIAALLLLATLAMKGAPGWAVMGWRQALVVGLTLAAGLLVVAFSLSRQLLPGARQWISTRLAWALAVGLFGFGVAIGLPWKARVAKAAGFHCALHELMFATATAAILLVILRRGVALAPVRLGATAGALAGLSGAMVLHFQCTVPEAPHVLLWHVTVPVLCAAGGALAGYLWQRRLRTETP